MSKMNKSNKPKIIHVSEHNSQYKITIPKEMAERLKLEKKDIMKISENNGIIIIEKIII